VILRIDPESAVPPYEQIRTQVNGMIRAGVLPAGTRLPAIRQLASDLGLAGGTVARAYRELEQAGVISTNGRRGTFVLETGAPEPGPEATRLNEAAREFAREAVQLGVEPLDALHAAQAALLEFGST
jgi:DNA-binding transcriptional regulator YhcF (GntR family)